MNLAQIGLPSSARMAQLDGDESAVVNILLPIWRNWKARINPSDKAASSSLAMGANYVSHITECTSK